ncbi:2Fe-2S iron-sulfur cluster-binding protein [Halalkalibacter okhensis]|uniref:2Fe-2S ferredoxin-type domain-containing protein n=1 Tax=Halalkalibacter okhensis TaxID=333138 RepID=A0A0B0IA57_9BACI|nr:2Fe-2S iron-sulfur cluster-binding protein [Halalkalibacter okhensis]KHF39403.1 hypothetical protein LQ50_15080 [Halalkalibacter okhensis]
MKLQVEIQRTTTHTNVYEVNYSSDMTVLTILEEIYRFHDPSIAYRFSCCTGLCATCMMMINGKPGLSCMIMAKPAKDNRLSLAPLPKGSTLRDLVKDI